MPHDQTLIDHVRTLVVCLAACTAVGESKRETMVAPRQASTPVRPAVRSVVTGAHGGPIAMLAITREGDAAISADENGAFRLWPTLDGSREPVVVHASAPRALAVAHDGDGFVIANIDAANGLELVRVDAEGAIRERAVSRSEPVLEVELVTGGVVVRRADQTIEQLDLHGASIGRLVPELGTRVVAMLSTGERVLAIVEAGRVRRARWIEPSKWGPPSEALKIDPARPLSVSRDGTQLLAHGPTPRLFDLTTWKSVSVCANGDRALGFIDDDVIACSRATGVFWWSIKTATEVGIESAIGEELTVAGHDVALSANGSDLLVRRRDGTKRLGYLAGSTATLTASAGGIVIGGLQHASVLDASLRARAKVAIEGDETLVPLDAGYAIALTVPGEGQDSWGAVYRVAVIALADGAVRQTIDARSSTALAYEPATHLVVTFDGADTRLYRYDPSLHTLGTGTRVATDGIVHRLVLLDPALANGLAAMMVEVRATGVIIGELAARDLDNPKIAPRRTYPVAGAFRAIDRAGRIYMATDRTLTIRSRGTSRELAIASARQVAPDPTGARFVVVSGSEVSLYRADGTRVWTTTNPHFKSAMWVGGELYAGTNGSLARLDVTSGAMAARQCGWLFGLHSPTAIKVGETANVCDAE